MCTQKIQKQIHTKNKTELQKKVDMHKKADTHTTYNRVTEY